MIWLGQPVPVCPQPALAEDFECVSRGSVGLTRGWECVIVPGFATRKAEVTVGRHPMEQTQHLTE